MTRALIRAIQQGDLLAFDQELMQVEGDLNHTVINIPVSYVPSEMSAVKDLMRMLHFISQEVCHLAQIRHFFGKDWEQRFPLPEITHCLQPYLRVCFPSIPYSPLLAIRALICFLKFYTRQEDVQSKSLLPFLEWLQLQSHLPTERFLQWTEKLKDKENVICRAHVFHALTTLKMKKFWPSEASSAPYSLPSKAAKFTQRVQKFMTNLNSRKRFSDQRTKQWLYAPKTAAGFLSGRRNEAERKFYTRPMINWLFLMNFAELAQQLEDRWHQYKCTEQDEATNPRRIEALKALFQYVARSKKIELQVPAETAVDREWYKFSSWIKTINLTMENLNPFFWKFYRVSKNAIAENPKRNLERLVSSDVHSQNGEFLNSDENVFSLWKKGDASQSVCRDFTEVMDEYRTSIATIDSIEETLGMQEHYFQVRGIPDTPEWLTSNESEGLEWITWETSHRHIVHLVLTSSLSSEVRRTMLEKLIQQKVNLDVLNAEGKSALSLALEQGHREIIFILLRVVSVREADFSVLCEGRSLISLVIDSGQRTLLDNLLKFLKNCNNSTVINFLDADGRCPLQIAFQREGGVGDMTLKLLEQGAEADIPDMYGIVRRENLFSALVYSSGAEISQVLQGLFLPISLSVPDLISAETFTVSNLNPAENRILQQYYGRLAAEAVRLGHIELLCFLLGYSQQNLSLQTRILELDDQRKKLVAEKNKLQAQVIVLEAFSRRDDLTESMFNCFVNIFYWICVYQFKMSNSDFERMIRSLKSSMSCVVSQRLKDLSKTKNQAVIIVERELSALQQERNKLQPYEQSIAELMAIKRQLVFFESFLQSEIDTEEQALSSSFKRPLCRVPDMLRAQLRLLSECSVAKLSSFTVADTNSPLLINCPVVYVRADDGIYYIERWADGVRRPIKLSMTDYQLGQFDVALQISSMWDRHSRELTRKEYDEVISVTNQDHPLKNYLPHGMELPLVVEGKTLMMIALQRGQWATASYLLSALEKPLDESNAYYMIHQFSKVVDPKLLVDFNYAGDYILARTSEGALQLFYCFYDGSLAPVNITVDVSTFYETIEIHLQKGYPCIESSEWNALLSKHGGCSAIEQMCQHADAQSVWEDIKKWNRSIAQHQELYAKGMIDYLVRQWTKEAIEEANEEGLHAIQKIFFRELTAESCLAEATWTTHEEFLQRKHAQSFSLPYPYNILMSAQTVDELAWAFPEEESWMRQNHGGRCTVVYMHSLPDNIFDFGQFYLETDAVYVRTQNAIIYALASKDSHTLYTTAEERREFDKVLETVDFIVDRKSAVRKLTPAELTVLDKIWLRECKRRIIIEKFLIHSSALCVSPDALIPSEGLAMLSWACLQYHKRTEKIQKTVAATAILTREFLSAGTLYQIIQTLLVYGAHPLVPRQASDLPTPVNLLGDARHRERLELISRLIESKVYLLKPEDRKQILLEMTNEKRFDSHESRYPYGLHYRPHFSPEEGNCSLPYQKLYVWSDAGFYLVEKRGEKYEAAVRFVSPACAYQLEVLLGIGDLRHGYKVLTREDLRAILQILQNREQIGSQDENLVVEVLVQAITSASASANSPIKWGVLYGESRRISSPAQKPYDRLFVRNREGLFYADENGRGIMLGLTDNELKRFDQETDVNWLRYHHRALTKEELRCIPEFTGQSDVHFREQIADLLDELKTMVTQRMEMKLYQEVGLWLVACRSQLSHSAESGFDDLLKLCIKTMCQQPFMLVHPYNKVKKALENVLRQAEPEFTHKDNQSHEGWMREKVVRVHDLMKAFYTARAEVNQQLQVLREESQTREQEHQKRYEQQERVNKDQAEKLEEQAKIIEAQDSRIDHLKRRLAEQDQRFAELEEERKDMREFMRQYRAGHQGHAALQEEENHHRASAGLFG